MFLVYWENTLVAMFSTLNLPSGTNKYGYRVHRTVVLPDFQGLGIGTKLLDFFGEWYLSKGEKLYLRSTHLRFANHCINSNKWIEGSRSQKSIKDITVSQGNKYKHQNTIRSPYSFEYVGENYNLQKKQYILCLGDIDYTEAKEYINKILRPKEYPIIVTGIASVEKINSYEQVAKEKGYRTEVLFIKRNDKYEINLKYANYTCDAIVIGRENQLKLSKIKHSSELKSLISFDYRENPPVYYERLQ